VHPNSVERLPFTLTESSVLAIIPARFQATRFPGKILADIGGRPMIEHVYRRASAALLVHHTLVATDDERIVRAVESFGGVAVMTRPDHVSGTDRIAEVAAALPCRLIVNVQGDEPLIEAETIDAAVAPMLADARLEMSTISRPFADLAEFTSPHVVKVVTDLHGRALYFSRSPIPGHTRGAEAAFAAVVAGSVVPSATTPPIINPSAPSAPSAARSTSASSASSAAPLTSAAHVGLYVYRRDILLRLAALSPAPLEMVESLEQLRALAHGIGVHVVCTRHAAAGVDTPGDLERVKQRLMASSRT
jgi:3-deoxy-manno-octulosonate cytidylyltransferase (CMP-KDO synthetase)